MCACVFVVCVFVRLTILSGDIFKLFDLLREFMKDQRVVLYEEALLAQEVQSITTFVDVVVIVVGADLDSHRLLPPLVCVVALDSYSSSLCVCALSLTTLSSQQVAFVQLLHVLLRALDCKLYTIAIVPAEEDDSDSANNGNNNTSNTTLAVTTATKSRRRAFATASDYGFVRNELVKYCANLGCVSWLGAVFNSFDGSSASQVRCCCCCSDFEACPYFCDGRQSEQLFEATVFA